MANDIAGNAPQIIADLRRELALRTAERDEALAQQTATAEVLQVINASPGVLPPVFDAMLERAMRLCEANLGFLSTYDGKLFDAVAMYGVPAAYASEYFARPYMPAPGTTHDLLVRGEGVVHITDLTADPLDSRRRRAVIEMLGVRTILGVALRREGELVGALHVYRQEVRPYTDRQITLLQNFAAQAVIAMENARLITETREALEQQTATAEVLRVINSSPGDLVPVFEAMLEKAMRLCEAAFAALWTYDGERLHPAALHRVPPAYAEFLTQHEQPVSPDNTRARLMRGEPFVHIPDAAVLPANPLRRAFVELGGGRAQLAMPLRKDGTLVGILTVYRQEARPFSDKQIALLQNFAAQAVIAMENARLITETREALEQQTATAEVLGVINSSPGDLAPVFDAMLERAMRLCEATFGIMSTYDGERFHRAAQHNVPAAYAEFIGHDPPQPSPQSALGRIRAGERVVHIEDYAREQAGVVGDSRRRALAELGGARSYVAVGLFKDDKLLGTLAAYRQEVRPFSDKQIALLENFAAQAVIAMENARLLGELRDRNNEIAEWNRELETRVAAQLAELEQTGKLRRFLAPQLAEMILARGDESILESHRREIVVVFCDVRGFTGFAERAEPEEVMAFLRDYHAALGPIVARFEGTLDHYSGDGIMVFFNDPLPTPEPAKRAIEMAVAMRETAQEVLRTWRRHGHDIGFGVGISQGYATLGQIGFAERMDYTAIGTVTNLAARLCAEAKDGQILISRRVAVAVEDAARLEEIGDVSLKGLSQAVAVFNVA